MCADVRDLCDTGSGPEWKNLVVSIDSSAMSSRYPMTSFFFLDAKAVLVSSSEDIDAKTYSLYACDISQAL